MMRSLGDVASTDGLKSSRLLHTVDGVEHGRSLNWVSPFVLETVFRLDGVR